MGRGRGGFAVATLACADVRRGAGARQDFVMKVTRRHNDAPLSSPRILPPWSRRTPAGASRARVYPATRLARRPCRVGDDRRLRSVRRRLAGFALLNDSRTHFARSISRSINFGPVTECLDVFAAQYFNPRLAAKTSRLPCTMDERESAALHKMISAEPFSAICETFAGHARTERSARSDGLLAAMDEDGIIARIDGAA